MSHGRHTWDTSAENERGSARVRMAKSLVNVSLFQSGSITILDISNLSKSSSSMLCSPTMTEMEEKMASSTQWAAVRMCRFETRTPPQLQNSKIWNLDTQNLSAYNGNLSLEMTIATCQGYAFCSVSLPPITLADSPAPPQLHLEPVSLESVTGSWSLRDNV